MGTSITTTSMRPTCITITRTRKADGGAMTAVKAPRRTRWLQRFSTCVAITLLASWPFAHRYTSFGLDLETRDAGRVRCTYWRVRWPRDGSLVFAHIVEHREVGSGPVEPFDLGGRFLQRAVPVPTDGVWQEQGFWWIDVDAANGPVPPIVAGADRAWLVGVPHWLVALAAVVMAAWMNGRSSPQGLADNPDHVG